MIAQTLKWIGGTGGFLELIDQRRLPAELVIVRCQDIEGVREAIRTLTVRGAPAIGVAGAYGLVLAMQSLGQGDGLQEGLACLAKSCDYLASARPTAVNLFWAMDRVRGKAEEFVSGTAEAGLEQLREIVLAEAEAIYNEAGHMCSLLGESGSK